MKGNECLVLDFMDRKFLRSLCVVSLALDRYHEENPLVSPDKIISAFSPDIVFVHNFTGCDRERELACLLESRYDGEFEWAVSQDNSLGCVAIFSKYRITDLCLIHVPDKDGREGEILVGTVTNGRHIARAMLVNDALVDEALSVVEQMFPSEAVPSLASVNIDGHLELLMRNFRILDDFPDCKLDRRSIMIVQVGT